MSSVNVEKTAELLCVHTNRVLQLFEGGVIPAAKIGRRWVAMERDVLDYLEAQIVSQTQSRRYGTARPRKAA
jgi:hypothetical protein